MKTRRARIVLGLLAPLAGMLFTSGVFLPLVLLGPLLRGAITEPVYVSWSWIGVGLGLAFLILSLQWVLAVLREAKQPRPGRFLVLSGLFFGLFGPAALVIVAVTGQLPL